jgi:SAM-dependent methyltransferase
MQNISYASPEVALASTCAPFQLSGCQRCGFLFNSRFDGALLSYDANYDNHVESRFFHDYYDSLARMLIARFGLDSGVVYDIGCGRGTFLKVLCAASPAVHGIGVDPSCEPIEAGNLTLLRSTFSRELIKSDAKLILLRHVLEHIPRPREFLEELRSAAGSVPLFVEVPESAWIFQAGAFWDFCYEHCNYFVPETLAFALGQAGFRVVQQERSFGGQYQWAICGAGATESLSSNADEAAVAGIEAARKYAGTEDAYLERARDAVAGAARRGHCAIWGMATKGVVLASLLPPGLLAGGVDSNPRKQGRFAPGSGLQIHPPAWLGTLKGHVTAMVMNPNYLEETREQVRNLGFEVELRAL